MAVCRGAVRSMARFKELFCSGLLDKNGFKTTTSVARNKTTAGLLEKFYGVETIFMVLFACGTGWYDRKTQDGSAIVVLHWAALCSKEQTNYWSAGFFCFKTVSTVGQPWCLICGMVSTATAVVHRTPYFTALKGNV